jgi:hypothetical protein
MQLHPSGRFWAILLLSAAALGVAADAMAGTTSILLNSDPGDYIGQGQVLFFAEGDGVFTARTNFDNGVSIAFNTPTFSHFWYLDFAAPNSQALTLGTYTNATRFPFQDPSQPGLSVAGDGRGCNMLTGSFTVLEISYGTSGDVSAFRATFEQHCEGAAPALRGEVRFNATIAVVLSAPSAVTALEGQALSFNVTAIDVLGRHVTLTATGVPPGATFVDNGNGTGAFTWTPTVGQAGGYVVTFRGDNGSGNTESVFTRITIAPVPPPNDDIGSPALVTGVPFTWVQNTLNASAAPDDPFCFGQAATVWFAFTPATNMRVEVNTFGSDYDTTLSAYTGARGALGQLACNDNASSSPQSRIRFDAVAGVTYLFMVSAAFGSPGGHLILNVVPGPPPLTVGLTIAGFGSIVPPTGATSVTGTLNCARPTFATISGQLKQQHAQETLTQFFFVGVFCDGPTDWTATMQSPPPSLFHGRAAALFVGGKAAVTASAFAFDPDSGESAQSNAMARIVLRGAR